MPDEQRRGPGVSQDGEAAAGEAAASPGPPSGSGLNRGSPWSADQQVAGEGAGPGILADAAALAAERDEYLTALQRLQADFENYRKRVQRQQEDGLARAEGALITKLLPILDVLDLAQAHLGESGGSGDADPPVAMLEPRVRPSRRRERCCSTLSPRRASSGSTRPRSYSTPSSMTR